MAVGVGLVLGLAVYATVPVAVVVAGMVALAGLVCVRAGSGPSAEGEAPRSAAVMAGCWLVTFVLLNHQIVSNPDPSKLSGRAPIHIVLEIGGFAAIVVLVAPVLRWRRNVMSRASPSITLVPLLGCWMMTGAVWSADRGNALARGGELVILGLLAWATVILGQAHPANLERILVLLLRWYAWLIAGLVLLGFAYGPLYASVGPDNVNRFTWPAAHPDASGLMLALGLVVVLSAPRRVLAVPPAVRVAAAAVMSFALFENQSRTAIIGVLLATMVIVWQAGRRRAVLRWLVLPYLITVGATVAMSWSSYLADYALRGGTTQQVSNLNSRTQLWGIAFDRLGNPLNWLIGLGEGAAQRVFIEKVAFAGNAHNSVLALLVNLGLIGLGLAIAVVFRASVAAVRLSRSRAAPVGVPLLGMWIVVVVHAVTSDVIAEPNVGPALAALLIAVAIVMRSAGDVDTDKIRERAEVVLAAQR